MKRRLLFLAIAVTASLLPGVVHHPVAAHQDACEGNGTLTTGIGLGLPGTTRKTTTFALTMNGLCAVKAALTLTGTWEGFCSVAVGSGVSTNGHAFDFIVTTAKMTFSKLVTPTPGTGWLTGSVTVVDDPTDTGSCLNGTADRFIVTGAIVLPPH